MAIAYLGPLAAAFMTGAAIYSLARLMAKSGELQPQKLSAVK